MKACLRKLREDCLTNLRNSLRRQGRSKCEGAKLRPAAQHPLAADEAAGDIGVSDASLAASQKAMANAPSE